MNGPAAGRRTKVVLLPSPTRDGDLPQVHLPLGLLSLATVLNRTDSFAASIFDLNRRSGFGDVSGIAREILDLDPDVLGFSGLCSGYPLSLRLAARCKELRPELKVLFGGPQSTVCAESTACHCPQVDLVVRGECDRTIVPILASLDDAAELAAQPGVTFRTGGRLVSTPPAELVTDLDSLPLPDYSLFPDYRRLPAIPVEVSRGCPFGCRFCCVPAISGRHFRTCSPERIVGLLSRLYSPPFGRRFVLIQDTFNLNREWVFAFCRALRRTGLDISWATSIRIDRLDPEMLSAMAEAGCSQLFFGLESASPRLQAAMGKEIPSETVNRVLAEMTRLGIEPAISHIIGFPDETREEMYGTIRQATRFRYDFPARHCSQLHLLAPLAGSPLYGEFKGRLQFDGTYSNLAFGTLSREETALVRDHPDLFSAYYYYPLQHLSREEVTRAAYLFEVLFTMRYTCFWLWRDDAFRYPAGLLESGPTDELPARQCREDSVAISDTETVIRFLQARYPRLAESRHPLLDVMNYDLAIQRARTEGPRIQSFGCDVHRFAMRARREGFRALHDPPSGPVTLLFTLSADIVEVRRLAK